MTPSRRCRDGAYNYIEKPVQEADIADLLGRATEAHALVQELGLSSPKMTLDNGEEFIGNSHQMRSVFSVIQRVGLVNTSVFIRGENGAPGKAPELRRAPSTSTSLRKDMPLVAANSAAILENLIRKRSFGHEKGAFTGADLRHIGKFQYAATRRERCFLDEIGEVSPSPCRSSFLRVLQERKFTPSARTGRSLLRRGRSSPPPTATSHAMIRTGAFRQDLYRTNVAE